MEKSKSIAINFGIGVGILTLTSLLGIYYLKKSKVVRKRRTCVKLTNGKELIEKYDAFVFDCDGVVWSGGKAIPGAIEALGKLKSLNKKLFFFTNSAASTREHYLEKFLRLGADVTSEQIHSSATCAATYLAENGFKNKKIYTIGEKGLHEELKRVGLNPVGLEDNQYYGISPEKISSITIDPEIAAVVVGFDRNISYYKISYAAMCIRYSPNVLFLATNLDLTFPVHDRLVPGNGGIVEAISMGAGRGPDVIAGKPNPTGLNLILSLSGIDKKKVLMTGDRLDTDIEFGNNAGVDTMLVLSGCCKESDGISAKPFQSPSYISDSINVFN